MLFQVRMDVNIPSHLSENCVVELKAREKELAQQLQTNGKWRHLWRIAGRYANTSIFDVESVEELHNLLQSLPLYPYMNIEVMPLCRHPSSIHHDDR